MKLKGARIIVECLKREGVDTIFGYPGGQVIPFFDDFYQYGEGIQLIIPRHEQGGAHAADGYSRATGKTGVVIATSGPGATNTVTGIATAYMDSIPMVIITGQVPCNAIGTDAFQEADITGITLPITKASFLVYHVEELAETMKMAFYIARNGRPGPVLVDIPSDIQKSEGQFHYPEKIELSKYSPKEHEHPRQIKNVIQLLANATKPLILAGGGVIYSDSAELLNNFADRYNVPVTHTMMGLGVYPSKESLYMGGVGMHGAVYANYAVQNCDLLIALGVRFSDRIVGSIKTFAPKARIVHVDIDAAEIGKNVRSHYPIIVNVKQFLTEILSLEAPATDYSAWLEELSLQKKERPLCYHNDGSLKPQYLLELINQYFPQDRIVVTDVGQNQIWSSQFIKVTHPRSFLTSGGLGTMGFALPAAIGAQIGLPGRPVIAIAGDGGFQMNIQELMTIRRYRLPIKILVLDNTYLGMVRQWQQLFCDKRYSGTCMQDNPDFAKIADAIGIHSATINTVEEAESIMREFAHYPSAMLVHAHINPEENVLPMVPSGASLSHPLTEL